MSAELHHLETLKDMLEAASRPDAISTTSVVSLTRGDIKPITPKRLLNGSLDQTLRELAGRYDLLIVDYSNNSGEALIYVFNLRIREGSTMVETPEI